MLILSLLRGIPTHRSWVKKIRFAPGKGNQKLLAMYNDGVEIWDSKEVSGCGFDRHFSSKPNSPLKIRMSEGLSFTESGFA